MDEKLPPRLAAYAEQILLDREDYLAIGVARNPVNGGLDIVLRIDGSYFHDLAEEGEIRAQGHWNLERLLTALGRREWWSSGLIRYDKPRQRFASIDAWAEQGWLRFKAWMAAPDRNA